MPPSAPEARSWACSSATYGCSAIVIFIHGQICILGVSISSTPACSLISLKAKYRRFPRCRRGAKRLNCGIKTVLRQDMLQLSEHERGQSDGIAGMPTFIVDGHFVMLGPSH